MVVLQGGEIVLARRMGPEAEHRRFRAGPREVGRPDLRPGGPLACARGCLGTLDEAARGHNILDPGATGARMHRVAQHQTHTLAEAGDGWPPGACRRLRRLGGLDERQRDSVQPPSGVVHAGQVDGATLRHGGSREPGRHAIPMRLGGEWLPDLGEVGRAVGLREVGEKLGALARQRPAPPEEVPGGAHRGGRDRRLGEPPAPPEDRHVLGVELLVLRLAAVEGLQRQGRPEDTREPCVRPQVGEPVPGEEAFDGDDEVVPRGRKGFEQGIGTGWHIPVQHNRAVLTQDTAIHGAGRQVDAAVQWVLVGGEAPEVSSSCACL